MVVLETVCVAFAMFSALPVPHVDWNERNMRYAMAAFPLVGAVIGALWCVCGLLPLPDMLKAAGFCLIPVAATGGIHLDGFADTSDALSSYGDREKKLAILKDPHCGAFAVIRLCGYFVLYFALCACLRFTPRVGAVFATAADKRRVQIVLLAVSVCVGAGMALLGGGLLALAALAVLWRYRAVAAKQFGGITGDLAGWFLQRAELVMLAALLISEGPLYSGKRTFAGKFGGRQIFDVQNLAAQADDLEWLADELAADYDVAAATEIGGGIVPMDAGERRAREAAGRLACLLAARADTVIEMFCGIPTVLKGDMPC